MANELNLRLHWTLAMIILVCDVALTIATILVDKLGGAVPPESGDIDTSAAIGWLSCFGALFCFGCYGILIKTPAVQEANTDPMVWQCYYSFSAAFISLVVWLAAGSSAGVAFSASSFAFGILWGMLWIASQVFAYKGIQILGYAVGPAIWIGVSILMSFGWGVAAFGESPKSWPGAVVAIAVLLVGVAMAAAASKLSDADQQKAREVLMQETSEAEKAEGSQSKGSPILGFLCALGVGFTNGSLMVPMSCFSDGCFGLSTTPYDPSGYDNQVAAMAFLPSLVAGVAVAQPICFLAYWGPFMAKGVWPQFHFGKVALPAFLTGLYWGMGNVNAMFATVYLGQTVGFPLTQCCLILNGAWGILYYKEIKGRAIGLFCLASLVILLGAAFDGLWA